MYRACIAVVDATRARLFTLERSTQPGTLRENLSEQVDLVNLARRRRPSELFSDTRPGTGRIGGLQYTHDDHRDAHIDQLDAEFARSVVAEIERLLQTAPAQRLIVCASPRMLGALRDAGLPRRQGLVLHEIPRDLVKLTPTRIREQLADYGVLPERVRPGMAPA